MNIYKPETVFSSIDHNGRYAYFNQPGITKWNLTKFAEALLPLIHNKKENAIEIAENVLNEFGLIYKKHWLEMMREKLGLFGEEREDEDLINQLLQWMHKNNADYTNTFVSLMKEKNLNSKFFQNKEFLNWIEQWRARIKKNKENIDSSLSLMHEANPLIIPRNHKIEEVLEAASINNDLTPLKKWVHILQNPYKDSPEIAPYQSTPPPSSKIYRTFCGT